MPEIAGKFKDLMEVVGEEVVPDSVWVAKIVAALAVVDSGPLEAWAGSFVAVVRVRVDLT